MSRVFRNKYWDGKRDYECTNIVACVAHSVADKEQWIEADERFLNELKAKGAQQLFIEAGAKYYGWL